MLVFLAAPVALGRPTEMALPPLEADVNLLAPMLAAGYERLLEDEDIEGFLRRAAEHFNEAGLAQLLATGEVPVRRAAALALNEQGTMRSNQTLAAALADADQVVRGLAEEALWAVWRRAGSAEQTAQLVEVMRLVSGGQLDRAVEAATALIDEAPKYAEARNQRAIAHFAAGRYRESIADCQRVLELNPVHFGAASGMGQCYEALGAPAEALAAYRRALEINPRLEELRGRILRLEGKVGD